MMVSDNILPAFRSFNSPAGRTLDFRGPARRDSAAKLARTRAALKVFVRAPTTGAFRVIDGPTEQFVDLAPDASFGLQVLSICIQRSMNINSSDFSLTEE